jgi:plasmid stabilization system protein ParE
VDYRLFFTQRALDDLAEIIAYIAEYDLDAPSRFGSSLLDHVDLLRRFPRMATRGSSKFSTAAMGYESCQGSESPSRPLP